MLRVLKREKQMKNTSPWWWPKRLVLRDYYELPVLARVNTMLIVYIAFPVGALVLITMVLDFVGVL